MRARLFLWTAAMIVCGFVVPRGAEILGFHTAGAIWNAFRLTWPWLSTAGAIFAGLIGGAVVGGAQWAIAPGAKARVIGAGILAGLLVCVVYTVYTPATVLAAPVAGAASALAYSRESRWVRAQALAVAWVALALMLPFPAWARAAFIVAAALLSAWGLRNSTGILPLRRAA